MKAVKWFIVIVSVLLIVLRVATGFVSNGLMTGMVAILLFVLMVPNE